MLTNITEMLYRLPIIFISMTVHEYAHGYAALKMGDHTAKMNGRLTLNPLKHVDIIGALCMLLFRFGWAKPVPINPAYFRDRKKGTILVSLAGPLSNLLLALLASVLFGALLRFEFGAFSATFSEVFYGLIGQLITLNVCFAVFNLIPIPPLDGSKIVASFLPGRWYWTALQYERYVFPVLLLLLYVGVLDKVLNLFAGPVIDSMNRIIIFIAAL